MSKVHDREPVMKPFGVACFHLAWRRLGSYSFRPSEYASRVKARLNALPTANNVVVDTGPEDEPLEVELPELPNLEDGDPPFPVLPFFYCSFDLYIPVRIQEELRRGLYVFGSSTERFHVHLRHTFHGPVCFVELIDNSSDAAPSEAVIIVREYLKRELAKVEGELQFEVLGPSPFHADFLLDLSPTKSVSELNPLFEVECSRPRGYAFIVFRSSAPLPSEHAKVPLEVLFDEIQDEIGLYYALIRRGVSADAGWAEIERQVLELIDTKRRTDLRSRFRRLRLRSRAIHDLHGALVEFEVEQLLGRQQIQNDLRGIYGKDERTYLRPFVDEAVAEQRLFPLAEVKSLLTFLEGRRSKALELLIVVLASLIGGVAGAALTAALQ